MVKWNKTATEGAEDFISVESCVHKVFQQQVLIRPDATAIVAHDGQFTYKELDEVTTKLAHHLVSVGVRPEQLVPYCFSKSIWAAVSVLSILKAGGAGVPLDPNHPQARLETILNDTDAAVIVTSPMHRASFQNWESTVIALDDSFLQSLAIAESEACSTVQPRNAAFVIFTSGSTGTPKGVVLEHRSMATNCQAYGKALHMNETSRVLQFATYTFDASIFDMCAALLLGGCVYIPSEYERLNDLPGFIDRNECNWILATSTIMSTISPQVVPSLKVLVLGGEPLSRHVLDTWAPYADVYNAYGPAEAAIMSACSGSMTQESQPSCIGKGLTGPVWLTEPANYDKLVPIGCIGEITVQGPGVSRGYLNSPEKTSQAFFGSPTWLKDYDGPHSRIYRTGDLARLNSDGSIECLGRKDNQVKLRGQRLELDEVSTVMSRNVEVRQSVVLKGSRGPCKERLIGFISLRGVGVNGESDDIQMISDKMKTKTTSVVAQLRESIGTALPSYMVPTVWVVLNHLPLTTSGKIFIKALRQWIDEMTQDLFVEITRFSTPTETLNGGLNQPSGKMSIIEQRLQNIWARVLNVPSDSILRSSTFLALGGDSVTAMRVMSLCRGEQLIVTVQDVLRNQSLASLARCVTYMSSISPQETMQEIYDTPVPLTPIQSMFFKAFGDAPNHYNQSFLLAIQSLVSEESLRSALNAVVTRHPLLRARFRKSNTTQERTQFIPSAEQQRISESYGFQHLHVSDDDTLEASARTAQASLDIESGHVFSATLFSNSEEQTLYLVAHHLVIDLVSWRIVLQDLEDVLSSGFPTTCTPLSYLQISQKRQAKARAPSEDQQRGILAYADMRYWELTEAENRHVNTRKIAFNLEPEVSASILGASNRTLRSEPIELFLTAMLSAFAEVFQDRNVPSVCVEGHGRDHELLGELDVSSTVGWFTTISPFHIAMPRQEPADISQTLKTTKDTLRQRRVSSQYYLDNFVSTSSLENHTFEILFNYEGRYQSLEKTNGLFRMLPLPASDFGDDVKRLSVFEIAVVVKEGMLEFEFEFNGKSAHQTRIASWVNRTEQRLKDIAAHFPGIRQQYSLVDFPLLGLDYNSLKAFIADLEEQLAPLIPQHEHLVVEEAYPCTGTQEGLLLAQGKRSSNYAVHEIAEVASCTDRPIDVMRLRDAWLQVVARHPILRTVFVDHPTNTGYHAQVVLATTIPAIDMLTCQSVEGALETWKLGCPSDYSATRPPHHLSICSTAGDKVLLRFEFSHSILDAQSVHLIMEDLTIAYNDGLDHEINVPRFSQILQHISERNDSADLEYWRTQLSGAEPCCISDLSEDSHDEVLHTQPLDLGISHETIQSFCKIYGVTPFTILQAAWTLVLGVYTFKDNVSFGYLASGRDAPITGIESVAGALVNMLVSHTKLSREATILEVVDSMQKRLTENLPHQYCPLSEMQHTLELGGQPLFNTVLDFQRPSANHRPSAAISIRPLGFHDPTEFHLTVHFELSDQVLSGYLAFWTSAVAPDYAQHIGEALTLALRGILEKPQQTVSDLNLVGQVTLDKYININTPAPVAREECLHDVFRKHALETPQAPAVFSTSMCLTFGELDFLSNKLGNYLIDMGVGPEVKVPMCFEKSAWAIVSMFAVWKAGGCLVALDPSHPESRLRGILDDVSASLILMSSQTLEACADSLGNEVRPIIVDASSLDAMQDAETRATSVKPQHAAYINFTSGTTGKPKGVVIEHRAIVSNIEPLAETSDITNTTRALQFSSYAWDAFYCETIMPLLTGGCTCIAGDDERSHDIAEFMRRAKCTWALFTPSFARLIAPEEVPELRTLLLGGEAMSADDKATWTNSVVLKNAYGPCEASIVALMHPNIAWARSEHNLSTRLAQTIWVVDPRNHHNLAPLGAPGELVLGGPPIGRGYINEPGKTAQAFVTDPDWFRSNTILVSQGFTSRFYRTGDLVRLNIDGSIGFIGRKDEDQVKLRGQRMELGEVEASILSHMSSAKQVAAAVISRTGQAESKQLVAFVTFSGSFDASGQLSSKPSALPVSDEMFGELKALVSTMAKHLPSFMIPSMFVPVTRIPLGSTTKVDRKALGEIAQQIPLADVARYSLTALAEVCQPTTPLEAALHELYADILAIPITALSVTDGFFQRGGDSIKAIKLVSAARQTNIALTVVDIFNNPTIVMLANVAKYIDANATNITIREHEAVQAAQKLKTEITQLAVEEYKMKPKQIQEVYPCTELQDTMIAISVNNPGSYMMQLVTAISEDADLESYLDAWKAVRRNNEILRTRILNSSERRYQIVYNDRMIIKNEESLQEYLKIDERKPMGYGDALARFALISEDDERHYFVATLHHAIYDGWSMSLIMDQISQACHWKPLSKPPAFSNYTRYLESQDRSAAEGFWLFELSGAATCDFPRLPNAAYQASAGTSTDRLMSLAQCGNSAPIAAVAKTAWALLLGLYSGSDDVVFATTNSGRNLPLDDIADLVGPTITTVPVRVRLDRKRTAGEIVTAVHQQSLAALPYEYLGLQNIRHISSDCNAACDLRSLFVVQPGDLDDVGFKDVPGVTIIPTNAKNFFTQSLVVECYMGQEKLKLAASFDVNVLSIGEVDRLLAQLEFLIQQLYKHNDDRLSAIDLLCPDDKAKISTWNVEMPPKMEECVQDIITDRMRESPTATAISSWDAQMTYQELDHLSSLLAAHLYEEMHVKTGDLIPLLFEKSAWAVVAMLAVVRAGGAFVFVDMKLPITRQQFIINSSKSNFILSSVKNQLVWSGGQWNVIEVSDAAIQSLPERITPVVDNVPDSLLYAIYTSGSTGVPKGCLIEHSAFLSSAASFTKSLLMSTDSRVLQFSSFAFDVSVMESLAVLTVGGCICIASEEAFESGIATMIQETQCNWASLTPSVARLMDPADVPSLRTLALVGEPLSPEDLKTWSDSLRLQNGYGPTECSILCVINPDLKAETDAGNTGYGSGGLTWIVDANDPNILMPIGCPGELLMEGPILARGYLDQPETTASAFIDGLKWSPNSRFYKTGDLVRYNCDGSIQCLGRKDDQVKVRGQVCMKTCSLFISLASHKFA